MSRDLHLRSDHYVLTRSGELSAENFLRRLHRHLTESCPDCREAWNLLSSRDREEIEGLMVEAGEHDGEAPAPPNQVPLHHRTAFSWEARLVESELREIRGVLTAARKKCWDLLQLPRDHRLRRIKVARTRYRSRAEAEYLLQKAQEVIRDDPREAENLASLVPHVLQRMPETGHTAWAIELGVRARAWEANALRVAGDLPVADHRFALLRRDLAGIRLEDPRVIAEVTSLEASLRIDQRRFSEAQSLLELALAVSESLGDSPGGTKVLIQLGNLWNQRGEPADALHCHEKALAANRGNDEPRLRLAAVNGQISSLCALGRFTAAGELLDRSLDLYEDTEELHAGALVRLHRGRIAFGLEQHETACEHLRDAREGFLATDRVLDALVATLDLAQVLAAQGKVRQVLPLAAPLMPLFQAHGVAREALVALKILIDAARTGAISQDLLVDLQGRLRSAVPSPAH